MSDEPKPTIYVETTVPSYLTARLSRDLVTQGHQWLTQQWWSIRDRYTLLIAAPVIAEVSEGDPVMARKRLAVLEEIDVLAPFDEIETLAMQYVNVLGLPPRAERDAAHLAYAVAYELDYLVTWNMKHLANSLTVRQLVDYNTKRALHVPVIVTPEYLLLLHEVK